MKNLFIFLLLAVASINTSAQEAKKFQFEAEVPLKLSVGQQTRKDIIYTPGVTVNVPSRNVYRNPVYGLNFTVLANITSTFSTGLGGGINGVMYENHPITNGEYYNRLMIPLYTRLRYQKEINGNFILLGDLNAGYQFSDNKYRNDKDGFFFVDGGGLLAGADIGFGTKINTYMPVLKLGYEVNQFNHAMRLDWGTNPLNLTPSDKITYTTYHHTFKISLAWNM